MDGTLSMAVLGLLLSAISLGWQVASHFLTAGRVRCELWVGRSGSGSFQSGPGYNLTSSPAHIDHAYTSYTPEADRTEYPHEVLIIKVSNVGRTPVTVTWPSAYFKRNAIWGIGTSPLGFEMTGSYYMLGPGETRDWVMPLWPAVLKFRAQHPDTPVVIRAHIGLGQRGRRRLSPRRNALTLSADAAPLP